jgi:hypothetical protein
MALNACARITDSRDPEESNAGFGIETGIDLVHHLAARAVRQDRVWA